MGNMFKLKTSVVKRYLEQLDKFIKIRVFTPEEVTRIISKANIETKSQYMALIVNACIVNYAEEILKEGTQDASIENIYSLCIEVNPAMDINRISIPATERASLLHLVEPEEKEGQDQQLPDLSNIEEELKRKIIGQEEAISSVSRVLRRSFVGLRDRARPIATFFFVGQTGVGKTAFAKAVTEFLYRNPANLLRIDCSEYAMPHEYSKLIGSPPGYVGYEHSGILSESMLNSAERIVLFDEIEKSDRKLHDLLLQITDDGFITDNKGRKIDFHNAILILTSNVGGEEIKDLRNKIGFTNSPSKEIDKNVLFYETFSAIKQRFTQEFINRLTEVVLFNPIGLQECEKIAVIFLNDVISLASQVPIELSYHPEVAHYIAMRGFKPEYGAREIRRTVEKEVEGPLSELILEKKIHKGDHIEIRVKKDSLIFLNN